jgi:hypothetical protein
MALVRVQYALGSFAQRRQRVCRSPKRKIFGEIIVFPRIRNRGKDGAIVGLKVAAREWPVIKSCVTKDHGLSAPCIAEAPIRSGDDTGVDSAFAAQPIELAEVPKRIIRPIIPFLRNSMLFACDCRETNLPKVIDCPILRAHTGHP